MAQNTHIRPKYNVRGRGGGSGPPIVGRIGEKSKDFKGTLQKILCYIKPQYKGLATVFAFALLGTVFSIAAPKLIGMGVDHLFPRVDFGYIGKILLLLLVLYLLASLFSYIQEYTMAGVAQRIIQRMRNDVAEKLQHLPLQFYDTRTHGEILSRVTNDIDTISTSFQQSLLQLVTAIFTLFGVTVMMMTLSLWLSLLTFLVLPLGVGLTAFIAKKSHTFYAGQQRALGRLNGHAEEMYGGHKVVRAFHYEAASIEEFNATNQQLYAFGWKAQFVSSVIFPLFNFLGNLAFMAICIVGGFLAVTGRMTLGNIQSFITYSRQFNQPISQVANITNILQSTLAAAERVFEILEETEESPDPVAPKEIDHPKGEIVFDHIKFRYDPDQPLIEDISLSIKPGDIVAIVGPTGAGKTTLVNLLMRFYELSGGRITIDGVDITQMKRKYLHRLFGMVLQDTWLFKGTIRENILYGWGDATEEELLNAADTALANPFIRALPDGYDTVINEEANNISEGQKQLLTIARAILINPSVLILDEATSSVDTRTELLIHRAMTEVMKGRTSFVIAHRLSTIRHADRILVMNKGCLVEQGTHAELLEKEGFYARLYNSQFAT
ncbi:MAG: ABC transporter ATP-binding protein/permease [Bacteroidetes bacterium]|nr:ABC transporter ATP-binding protein/permease [Bacteroidota bacterium]